MYTCAGYIDITPLIPVPLAGFSMRTNNFTGVADPLEANVLILQQGGCRTIIVSLDLLYVGRALRAGIMRHLKGLVKEEDLFLAATHTHFAPAVDNTKQRIGIVDHNYLSYITDRIASLIVHLLTEGDFQPAILFYKTGPCDLCVNRRKLCWQKSYPVPKRKLRMQPNTKAIRETHLRLIQVVTLTGHTMAVLWNYSCHPVCFPFSDQVSADYPGAVRAGLRHNYDHNLPVVFLQGFSGNIRPKAFSRSPGGPAEIKNLLKELINGQEFGPFLPAEWDDWVLKVYRAVYNTLNSTSNTIKLSGDLTAKRTCIPLPELGLNGPETELTLHSVSIGETMKIIGISAEPAVEYAGLAESIFRNMSVLPAGCIDHVFGYLPTPEMLKEGGYEATGFFDWFELKGEFTPGFLKKVVYSLKEL